MLDEHGNLKFSDFGLSSLYVGDADGDVAARTQLLHTTCGTPNYVAPEVLSDQGYDGKKADVWSIGVILYVLLAGFLPFDESTIVLLFNKIKNGEFTYPSWFTPEVRSLIDVMLVTDPKARATLAQVKLHPWLRDDFSTPRPLDVKPVNAEFSESQLSTAVAPLLKHTKKSAGGSGDDEDVDDVDDGDHSSPRGIQSLNAFELVAKCGGF